MPLITQQINFDVLSTQKANLFTPTTPNALRKNFFDDLKNFPDMPIQVMQKYFMQSPNKIEEPGRNIYREGYQKYGAILRHIAKLREKNLLIITPNQDAKVLNDLAQNILKDFQNAGAYILQPKDAENGIIIDMLHPIMNFGVKLNFSELRGVIESFHVTDIFLDDLMNFNANEIKFLESCGTTVKNFEWRR